MNRHLSCCFQSSLPNVSDVKKALSHKVMYGHMMSSSFRPGSTPGAALYFGM